MFEQHATHQAEQAPANGWLTAAAAAAYLGMSRKALYQAVRRGQIQAHRLGRRLRFRREELDAAVMSAGD